MRDVSEMQVAKQATDAIDEADLEGMKKFGIIPEPSMSYLVGPYRYSKFADALAQAKRLAASA
ncbi:hypothetical protein [Croceicoccus estronivorus]|uniref:hypothetical protein n=1 Tax=Croceicoccus estronivorus TaxID=1172626 RepID=UPI000A687435|nr:hypothetical protein [Croceicoccus estronivorus]